MKSSLFLTLIIVFCIQCSIADAGIKKKVKEIIDDAKEFVEDAEDVVNDAESDKADDLMEKANYAIDLSDDLHDNAQSKKEYKKARHWARVAVHWAMAALDEPEVALEDKDELAKERYEKEFDEAKDKKESAESVVYGDTYGDNQRAIDILENGDGVRDVAEDLEEQEDYFKAYYTIRRAGNLYALSKHIAKNT